MRGTKPIQHNVAKEEIMSFIPVRKKKFGKVQKLLITRFSLYFP